MDRRTFIRAVAAAMIAAPLAASAQTRTTVRRIGQFWTGAPETPAEAEEFAAPMRALGWVWRAGICSLNDATPKDPSSSDPWHRSSFRSRWRSSWRLARTPCWRPRTPRPPSPSSLGPPAIRAAAVSSRASPGPGGISTRFPVVTPELEAKQPALLHELLPGLQRVGLLEDSTYPIDRAMRPNFEQAC